MVSSWRWNTLREAAWKRRARSQLSRGLWRIHPVDAAALLQVSVGWGSKHVVVVVAHSMTTVLSTSTESGFYASWASVMYKMSRYLGIHAIWCDVQMSRLFIFSENLSKFRSVPIWRPSAHKHLVEAMDFTVLDRIFGHRYVFTPRSICRDHSVAYIGDRGALSATTQERMWILSNSGTICHLDTLGSSTFASRKKMTHLSGVGGIPPTIAPSSLLDVSALCAPISLLLITFGCLTWSVISK